MQSLQEVSLTNACFGSSFKRSTHLLEYRLYLRLFEQLVGST